MPNVSDRLVAGFRQRVKLRLDVMANELKQEMLASLAPHIDEAVSRALADELETLVAVHLSAAGDQLVIQLDRTPPPAPVPPIPPVSTPPVDTPPVEAPPTPVEVLAEPSIPVSEPAPTSEIPPVDPDRPTPPDHPTPGGRA